jgi:hypothetical protein
MGSMAEQNPDRISRMMLNFSTTLTHTPYMLVLEIHLSNQVDGRTVHTTHTAIPHSLIMSFSSYLVTSSTQWPQPQGSPQVLLLLPRYQLEQGVAPSASHPQH